MMPAEREAGRLRRTLPEGKDAVRVPGAGRGAGRAKGDESMKVLLEDPLAGGVCSSLLLDSRVTPQLKYLRWLPMAQI